MYNEKDIISKWNSEMYDCNETETYDVDFALSIIGNNPKRILEIACGSGRFLVPMAEAGHDVTGLDFDEYMLDKISRKISSAQNIQWRKLDVINEEWGTGFDIVLLVANFLFNIVSDMDYEQAQELMIRKASGALVSGGHVLIDYAHNAISMESLLSTLKDYNPDRLVCIFGGGGNKPAQRRFDMGKMAGKYADLSIITMDNPRYEAMESINQEIVRGINSENGIYKRALCEECTTDGDKKRKQISYYD